MQIKLVLVELERSRTPLLQNWLVDNPKILFSDYVGKRGSSLWSLWFSHAVNRLLLRLLHVALPQMNWRRRIKMWSMMRVIIKDLVMMTHRANVSITKKTKPKNRPNKRLHTQSTGQNSRQDFSVQTNTIAFEQQLAHNSAGLTVYFMRSKEF